MQSVFSIQIMIISSKTRKSVGTIAKAWGQSWTAPEQRWVVAPRGAELVSPGRSPGWENPPIWQPPASHRPLAATASQGDCKNLPVGPVRHIKWFNCLWRLLSHLNVLERNKCCFQCSSKGDWAVSRQVVRLEAGYWGQPQVQATMLPQDLLWALLDMWLPCSHPACREAPWFLPLDLLLRWENNISIQTDNYLRTFFSSFTGNVSVVSVCSQNCAVYFSKQQ